MTLLLPGQVLCSSDSIEDPISPMRILHVDRGINRVVMIPCQPRKSKGRTYFKKHRAFKLKELEEKLSGPDSELRVREIRSRMIMRLSDEELRIRFPPRGGEGESKHIEVREKRWSLIKDLVTGPEAELLLDPTVCSEILQAKAAEQSRTAEEQKRWLTSTAQALYQYFALGSQKAALLPFWENCGGRGKKKKFSGTRLGRPNAPTAAGVEGHEGYVLTDNDVGIIEFCWRHYLTRGTSVAEACRRMWREFYSTEEMLSDGSLKRARFPANQRPTEVQFRYWGEKETGESASSKQHRHNHFLHIERPLPGSAADGIHAVGQKAALDSTTTDVELVSLISRLDRIGTAYRTLVVDMLYGYIPGFYMGLTPPCSETTKLAYLHAMSEKTEWLESLGLDHLAEDWIPIRFQDGLGDNTESRAEQVHRELLDTGVMLSLQYVPTYRSDLNALAETAHHSLHRLVDHKFLGSTRGEKKDKKEDSAAVRARHTLVEIIRDTADAVHHYNTVVHPDWVLPLDAKREGVRPTRLEMTKWAMSKGRMAVGVIDIDTARSQLLPVIKGVFTESGVKLFRPDKKGNKVYIKHLRYVSSHEHILLLMQRARKNGVVQADFRVDPFALKQIWYLDIETGESIALNLKTNDPELSQEATFIDVVRIEQHEEVQSLMLRNERDVALCTLEDSQEETKSIAEMEYQDELNSLNKKPSKKSLVANKAENREREKSVMMHGIPMIINDDQHPQTIVDVDAKPSYQSQSLEKGSIPHRDHKSKDKSVFQLAVESRQRGRK